MRDSKPIDQVPPEVWPAFAAWIRHVDSHLNAAVKKYEQALEALKAAKFEEFAQLFGEVAGNMDCARADIASALARGLTPPNPN